MVVGRSYKQKMSSSKVWQYFSRKGNEQVKCGVCEELLSYKGSSTSSMKRHLERKHTITVDSSSNKKLKLDDEKLEAIQQPKINTYIASLQKFDKNSPKAKKLEYKIAKTMFLDLQPLSIVEDTGFQELMSEAEGRFVLPSRNTFRNNILPKLYNDAAAKLKTKIDAYRKQFGDKTMFGVTTDGWTSSATTSFVTYTLHIIDNYNISSYVISTVEFPKRHTAHNLRAHLLQTLIDWNIFTLPPQSDKPTSTNNIPVADDAAVADQTSLDDDPPTAAEIGKLVSIFYLTSC